MAATLKTTVIQEPSSGTVNMTLGSTGGVTFGSFITSNTITSAASTALTIQSAGTTAMTIDTSQNVGIGTSSPVGKLDVVSAAQDQLSVRSNSTTAGSSILVSSGNGTTSNNYSYIQYQNAQTSAYNWKVGTFGSNSFSFYDATAAAERMRIDTSGNLLVGTTSTTSVNAGIAIIPNGSSGTTGYVRIGHSSATSGQGYLDFLYNNSIIGSVQQAGTTGVSFNTSSDYRLKENVTPMTTGLATIAALKPVNYDWISDKSAGEGFIAHELQAIIPNAVTGEKDAVNEDGSIKPQGVDYSKIVVHLVAAIQELSAKVDAQAAEITALQAKVGA